MMREATRKKSEQKQVPPPTDNLQSTSTNALVFISHDTRDADLAEAFGNLLQDVSAGMLKSFRSSDKKGTTGIAFGEEWYTAVMSKLDQATDVVALLTPYSVGRPWILYETGVAKGKLSTDVSGIAIGIPLSDAIVGPFGQFQNLEADEDSLTKLVLQLIKRRLKAEPREAAIRRQVQGFLQDVGTILKGRTKNGETKTTETKSEVNVAKMFEEVKVLVRDLPDRMESQLREMRSPHKRWRRGMPPDMLMDCIQHDSTLRKEAHGLSLLVFFGFFREDLPWLYDLALDYYHSAEQGDGKSFRRARKMLIAGIQATEHGPIGHEFMRKAYDDHSYHVFRRGLSDIGHMLERVRVVVDKDDAPSDNGGGDVKTPAKSSD